MNAPWESGNSVHTWSFLLLLHLFLLVVSSFRGGRFLAGSVNDEGGADAGDDVENCVENDRGRVFNLGDHRRENHQTAAEDIAYAHRCNGKESWEHLRVSYPHSHKDSNASASCHSNQKWERDPGILGVNETKHKDASGNLDDLEAYQDILCTHDTDQKSRE